MSKKPIEGRFQEMKDHEIRDWISQGRPERYEGKHIHIGRELMVIDEDMKRWFADEIEQAVERRHKPGLLNPATLSIMLLVIFTICIVIILSTAPKYAEQLMAPVIHAAETARAAGEAFTPGMVAP